MTGHQAVLLNEAIEGLEIKPNGIYIDATFGRGGHSRAILEKLDQNGRLIAIDKDLEAIAYADATFKDDQRFVIEHGSFADLSEIAKKHHVYGSVSGILLDLGVSSPQLDNPERGFSFMQDGPLDMRMNTSLGMTAAEFVNQASLEEMKRIFKLYGEERFATRIAKRIIEWRTEQPFQTTKVLADVVSAANPKWEKHKHPATRVFQAIRIHINRELEDLEHVLKRSIQVLDVGGRLVVISFHSLEDRIVKHFMREQSMGDAYPVGLPLRADELNIGFKCIGKAIKATARELAQNVRARSAVMRIGEKIA